MACTTAHQIQPPILLFLNTHDTITTTIANQLGNIKNEGSTTFNNTHGIRTMNAIRGAPSPISQRLVSDEFSCLLYHSLLFCAHSSITPRPTHHHHRRLPSFKTTPQDPTLPQPPPSCPPHAGSHHHAGPTTKL